MPQQLLSHARNLLRHLAEWTCRSFRYVLDFLRNVRIWLAASACHVRQAVADKVSRFRQRLEARRCEAVREEALQELQQLLVELEEIPAAA